MTRVRHRREAGWPDLQRAEQGQQVPLHVPGRVLEPGRRDRRHRRADRRPVAAERAAADRAVVARSSRSSSGSTARTPSRPTRPSIVAKSSRGADSSSRSRAGVATWRHSVFAVLALVGWRVAKHVNCRGDPVRADERVQSRILDPRSAAVGLEREPQHQRRLAIEPVLLQQAPTVGGLAHHAVEDRRVLAGIRGPRDSTR